MFKTLDNDRKTIERKYHNSEEYDSGKVFGVIDRMKHHGYDYDELTGLSDSEIDSQLEILSAELEGSSHPVHKAKLFEYVLDNTRIDINEHDYFIGMYTWNRPVSKYTVNKWSDEVYSSFPEASETISVLENPVRHMVVWLLIIQFRIGILL